MINTRCSILLNDTKDSDKTNDSAGEMIIYWLYHLFSVPVDSTNLGQVMKNVKDGYDADEVRLVILVSDFINMQVTPDMVTSATDLKNYGIRVSISYHTNY